jgi:hypothetical protein
MSQETSKIETTKWQDDIEMDLKVIWCKGADWVHFCQGRVQW